jgi:sterol desaturase/sphingolipid hydroxylase (fatty acid hydroxylase superfamily)
MSVRGLRCLRHFRYMGIKVWQSVDAHSGYNLPFPLSPWSTLPGMDCAPAHSFHHSHNTGNFGGFTMFWDHVCGTDLPYRKHLAKMGSSGGTTTTPLKAAAAGQPLPSTTPPLARKRMLSSKQL